MEKSEKLRADAENSNDVYEHLKLIRKSCREERLEGFQHKWLKQISELFDVENISEGKFTIFGTDYGIIDFFPKSNKVLVRKTNEWINPGLKWIIKNILKIRK